MNITVTDQENCKKQLHLEIPGEVVRAETDKVAGNLARQMNIPGFRPGHAPKSVVKTRFRKELRDEVVSHLLPESLQKAISDKDLIRARAGRASSAPMIATGTIAAWARSAACTNRPRSNCLSR